jgi:hypothetical protein
MVDAAIFPVSRCGQRSARRAPNLSGIALDLEIADSLSVDVAEQVEFG